MLKELCIVHNGLESDDCYFPGFAISIRNHEIYSFFAHKAILIGCHEILSIFQFNTRLEYRCEFIAGDIHDELKLVYDIVAGDWRREDWFNMSTDVVRSVDGSWLGLEKNVKPRGSNSF